MDDAPENPCEDRIMRLTEAADYLQVKRTTIYRWISKGYLPYFNLVSGGGRRVRKADVDALLKRGNKEDG